MIEFAAFAFFIGLIAAVGHGIWILAAWVLRSLLGTRSQKARPPERCAFCKKLTSPAHDRCDWCGRELRGQLASELKDLDAVDRQLHRFRNRGTLKPKVVDEMLARVERYRERLLHPQPIPRPAAAAPEQVVRPVPGTTPDRPKVVDREDRIAPPVPPATPPRPATPPVPASTGERPTPATPPHKRLFTSPPTAAGGTSLPAKKPTDSSQTKPPAPRATKPATTPPQPPPVPRRSWPEMVAGFMQEQNIRWGELVGGVLIVGSSVALVLNLWDKLNEIRYFPFFIFVAVTAALFGVGLYAHYRWKLASTSFGLLVIATLLVPLDFLAMAAFSKNNPWDIVTVLTGLGGLALFAWLVLRAAEVLTPAWRLPQVVAVVGSSAAVLWIAWRIDPLASPVAFFVAGAVPVACFAYALGWAMHGLPRPLRVAPDAAGRMFTLLGTGGFAAVAALGLLTAQSGELAGAFDRLSVFVALMGVPILACGLAVARGAARRGRDRATTDGSVEGRVEKQRKEARQPLPQPLPTTLPASSQTTGDGTRPATSRGGGHLTPLPQPLPTTLPDSTQTTGDGTRPATSRGGGRGTPGERAPDPAAYHTAGTATALIGMLVMLVALVLAWPHPLGIILVGGLNAVALALAAFWFRQPILHVGAIACVTVVYLIGFHVAYGPSELALLAGSEDLAPKLLRLLLDASSGTALAGLFVLLAAFAEWLARTGRHRHGMIYAGGAAVVAVAGLLLVTRDGFMSGGADAVRAACLYGLYGAGGLLIGGRWRRTDLNIVALALLAATPLWLLWNRIPPAGGMWERVAEIDAIWAAVLAGESLLLAVIATGLSLLGRRSKAKAPVATAAESAGVSDGSDVSDRSDRSDVSDVSDVGAGRNLQAALIDSYRLPLLYVTEALAILAVLVGVATAWLDRATLIESPWPVLTALGTAAAYLLLAWLWNTVERTWIGSMIFMVGIAHALLLNFSQLVEPAWTAWVVALLAHSTLAILASLVLSNWASRDRTIAHSEKIQRLYQHPLADSALVSSVLAAATLPLVSWKSMTMASLAWCLGWIAAVWLVEAWRRRQPLGFAAHQIMLVLTGLAAVTAWLQQQDWFGGVPGGLADPRSVAAYVVVVALLALMWAVARIVTADGLRGWGTGIQRTSLPQTPPPTPPHNVADLSPAEMASSSAATLRGGGYAAIGEQMVLRGQAVARQLLNPPWPSVDWVVRHAAVWLLVGSVVVFLLPSVAREFISGLPTITAAESAVASMGVWLAVGLLALVLVVTLWEKFGPAELLGSLLLAATAAGLIAGAETFVADVAVGSALRWGLSACFVICSVGIWVRHAAAGLAQRWKCHIELGGRGAQLAHGTLLAVTLLPVLSMTVLAAVRQMAGMSLGGPAVGSWFATAGPTISYLIPLLLLVVGLVGSAVRERSAGYAFSAGLIVELAVGLGYALHIVNDPAQRFGVAHYVTLLQLLTITAAVWAGAWLTIRHWLDIWRETSTAPRARLLMNLQLAMGAVGNGLLISVAVVTIAMLHPHAQAWTIAAGKPLGWIAFMSVAGAYVYRVLQSRRSLSPQLVGLLGMTFLALVACTVQWQWPEWGYRTLMLGWAVYAWSVVAATWWVASTMTRPDAQGPPQALIRAAAVWVRLAGIAAVLLGLKLVVVRGPGEDLLWAAAAIAIASAAGATMAVWQRREGWAFAAALGVNLAASLVVWHGHHQVSFEAWWLYLIQANIVASSAVALVWLAARQRLYQLRELRLGDSPLLAAQTALPTIGNVVLLAAPVVWLLGEPAQLPIDTAQQLSATPGWLALVLTAAAAGWYVYQLAPHRALSALVAFGLGLGVLCACHAQTLVDSTYGNTWLAYHTLTTAWAIVGLVVLGAGLLAEKIRFGPKLAHDGVSVPMLSAVVPAALVEMWVTAIGALVVLLAVIHSTTDPQHPWWSAGALLATSLMAGVVAIWRRRSAYVYLSGLLLCGIGIIAWLAWDPSNSASRLMVSVVLALACGSAIWSVIGLAWREGVPHPQFAGRELPFVRLAGELAVALLGARAAVAAFAAVADPRGLDDFVAVGRLDSLAIAATLLAAGLGLWQRRTRLAVPGLWLVGLEALVLGLCAMHLQPSPRGFCWAATLALAGFVLATALLGTFLPRLSGVWQALRIPVESRQGPADWLPAAQAVLTGVAALLAAWVAVDAGFLDVMFPRLGWPVGQVAAPLTAALLLAAAVMMTSISRGTWRTSWQEATFGLALLLFTSIGFVSLVPESAAWLHRSVIVLVAAVAMGLIAGLGPARLAPARHDWITAGRRMASLFVVLAAAMLALVLVQEAWLFDPAGGVVAWQAAVIVALAIAGLIVMAIGVALRPDWDPLKLSDRGRTVYVYAAELLGGLLAFHLWLALPWLFQFGLVERYWMLIVMAIAAAGAGLSELFERRRLPVLSEPLTRTALLLPLVPVVGFWFVDSANASTWLPAGASPSLWFVIGLFYGVMAITRKSLALAGLAILTANTGLWVLWQRQGLDFFDHPQLWLIPIAIVVLVAEHLDRGRLDPTQRTSLRYIALALIYVSSTTEFMRGIGESITLPLVLIGLSLLGVLAGILLRVRSFLYLGTTFLLVVIVRMIVYAAFEQGQMWVFWSCCILLGAAIIALFAVFEKRRNDVVGAVERLKEWEG